MAKRALCIGINDYPGTDNDLSGCVNDAMDWRDTLKARDFAVAELFDRDATKAGMLEALSQLVSESRYGDVAIITFSGHGTWQPDMDGDEEDKRDEALCPHDVVASGPLLDDELFAIFRQRKRGSRIVLISDSCHSGTVTKFAPPLGSGSRRVRYLAPDVFLPPDVRLRALRVERAVGSVQSRTTALLMAGCRDNEYSYDAEFAGRPNGAFTYVALQCWQQLPPDATYKQWMAEVRKQLPSQDYPQTPELHGTSPQRDWRVLT